MVRNEASCTRIGLHLIPLLAKGSHGNPQTTWADDKAISCSSQTDSKTPLLKTTSTQLTEHGEVKLVPTESFTPSSQCSQYKKILYTPPKEKCKHQPSYKCFYLQRRPAFKILYSSRSICTTELTLWHSSLDPNPIQRELVSQEC